MGGFSDARNDRDRADRDRGKSTASNGGDAGAKALSGAAGSGKRYSDARDDPSGLGRAPASKKTEGGGGGAVGAGTQALSTSAADHAIATGAISAPSIPSTGVNKGNYKTQDDAYNDYARAVGDWGTRTFGNKLADFLGGPLYDEEEPMAGNPRSFAGGRFHSSSNPGGVVAGLAPYGSGFALGPLASDLYDDAGLPDVWHGGLDQPDVRTGPLGNAPAGTDLGKSFDDLGGMSTPAAARPASSPAADRSSQREIPGRPYSSGVSALIGDAPILNDEEAGQYSDVMLQDRRKPYAQKVKELLTA